MMMNKTALTLAGLLVTTLTGTAMAAGTADMTVGGTVLAGSCTPTLSSPTIDYGVIDVSTLTSTNTSSGNDLGYKSTTLNITCDSPMKVAFELTDNRADSVKALTYTFDSAGAQMYGLQGLGFTADGKKIGSWEIGFLGSNHPTYDGNIGDPIHINKPYMPIWMNDINNYANIIGYGGLYRYFTVAESGTAMPVAFTNATFPLSVRAQVDVMSNLNLTDDTPLDGSATLSLVYL